MNSVIKNIFNKKKLFITSIVVISAIVFVFSFAGMRISNMEFATVSINNDKTLEQNIGTDQKYDFKDSILSAKWSGLGMGLFSTNDNNWELSAGFGDQVNALLSNGFTQVRIDIPYYSDTAAVEISKSAVLEAVAKGAQVIWGVSCGAGTITADNWPVFRQSILDAAKWAQDNGVYEFQLGNEEESHVDGLTMTKSQIRINLISVASEVKSIFTNGKISYSCAQDSVPGWTALGKGDIDFLAMNAYMGGTEFNDNWKTDINTMLNAFGSNGTYITEFSPSAKSLELYSSDESLQAAAVNEMIDYFKSIGITRALSFCYYDDSRPFGPAGFGVFKTDKTFGF